MIGAIVLALVAAAVVFAAIGAVGHDNRDVFIDSRPPPDLPETLLPARELGLGRDPAGWRRSTAVWRLGASGLFRADVLILPDYGESAETWFETARDLNAAGYTVWVLEGVGEGGSARLSSHRDLGELHSFDGDVAGARGMIDAVIRPPPGRQVVLLGQGVGALVATRLAETGAEPAGLVLSAPRCAPATPAGTLVYVGLGGVRAPGGDAWARRGPDDFAAHRTHDHWRGAVTHAWQTANPDLRLGGSSLDWQAGLARLQRDAEAGAGRLKAPTLVIDDGKPHACLAPQVAVRRSLVGADQALELEDDRWRGPWLAAVLAFVADLAKTPAHT
ncbi:MAG: alpha/beta hydrolase [Caulobacteraceae bacterium]